MTNVTSILPGQLVQCLITAVLPTGLNFQVLGFFDGVVDAFHLPPGDPTTLYKIGQKIKARVLYEIPGNSPPRFSLSLSPHILGLDVKHSEVKDKVVPTIKEAYPIGTILEAVRVARVEAERGLVVEVRPGIQGFIHVGLFSHYPLFRRHHSCIDCRSRTYRTITYPPFPLLLARGSSTRHIVPELLATTPWTASYSYP